MSLQGPEEAHSEEDAAAAAIRRPVKVRNTREMVRTRCYRDGVLTDEGFPLGAVSEHLEDASALVWAGSSRSGPGGAAARRGRAREAYLGRRGRHRRPPAAEVQPLHRQDFLTAHAVHPNAETGELVTGEIAAFITTALVTVQNDN